MKILGKLLNIEPCPAYFVAQVAKFKANGVRQIPDNHSGWELYEDNFRSLSFP